MSRTRWIQGKDGKLVRAEDYYAEPLAPLVYGDIDPYQSTIDGSLITSRSKHREHLRAHGCFEVGNEVAALVRPERADIDPVHRKELIIAQVQALGGHEAFKAAVKRDIDFVKWNSNK